MEREEERAHLARMAHVEAWFSTRSGRPVTAEVVTRRAGVETRVHGATGPLLRFERHPTRRDAFRLVFDGSADPEASSATPWLVVGDDVIDVLEAPGELAVVKPSQRFEFHDPAAPDGDGRALETAAQMTGAGGGQVTPATTPVSEGPPAEKIAARTLPGNLFPGGSRFVGALDVDLVDGRLVVTGRRATPRTVIVAAVSRTLFALSLAMSAGLILLVASDVRSVPGALLLALFVAVITVGAVSVGATVASWIWTASASPVQSAVFPAGSVSGKRLVVARGPVGPNGRQARLVMRVSPRAREPGSAESRQQGQRV